MEIYPPIAYTVGSTHVGTNVRTTVNTLYGVHVTMNASRMALIQTDRQTDRHRAVAEIVLRE